MAAVFWPNQQALLGIIPPTEVTEMLVLRYIRYISSVTPLGHFSHPMSRLYHTSWPLPAALHRVLPLRQTVYMCNIDGMIIGFLSAYTQCQQCQVTCLVFGSFFNLKRMSWWCLPTFFHLLHPLYAVGILLSTRLLVNWILHSTSTTTTILSFTVLSFTVLSFIVLYCLLLYGLLYSLLVYNLLLYGLPTFTLLYCLLLYCLLQYCLLQYYLL
jgi:hypothetical protein